MKVLNFGSLNIDHVYKVNTIVKPGETIDSEGKEVFFGGKGLNQSIALAKAGLEVIHAGTVGQDANALIEFCQDNGIDTTYLRKINSDTGHTVIQVDSQAQNCIILFGGANRQQDKEFVDQVLSQFGNGDILILQNEINELPYIIDKAYEKDMQIILNPSPYNSRLEECDLSKVSIFILNEIEGQELSGEKEPQSILEGIRRKYPRSKVLLTLGKDGAFYSDGEFTHFQNIFQVEAVDTTAAGDTFTGYYVAGLINKLTIPESMELAAMASALAVSKKGASASIPYMNEVRSALKSYTK